MNMAEQIGEVSNVLHGLVEILEDAAVPKNVRTKIESIILALRQDTEILIKVNKALSELDEISSDINLQSYTRTQIWNVMSILEKIIKF